MSQVYQYTPFGADNVYAYYLKNTYISNKQLQQLLSFSKNYNKPLKFVLNIYDPEGTLLSEYDSFDARFHDQEINVFRVGVNEAQDQTGDFFISFFDHENNIDQDKLLEGSKIIISMGRTPSKMTNIMYGIMKNKRITRGRMEDTYIDLGGFGSEVIMSDTQAKLIRTAAIKDLSSSIANTKDESMYASNLLLDFFENESYMEDDFGSLRDRGEYDLSLLKKSNVTDFIGSIGLNVDALSIARRIADLTLSYFKVNNYNQPVLEYGNNKHSGVTLKQYNPNDKQFDYANRTSYFKGDWALQTSTERTTGFANVLISNTGQLRNVVNVSAGSNAFISLFNKDLAQAIDITSPFRDLTLLLSKKNGGSPNLTDLHGHLIRVKASDNKPTGAKISTFNIPLNQIPDGSTPSPVTIPVQNLDNLFVVGTRIAIQLFEIGDSENRSVYWHHDANFAHPATDPPSYIRPLPNGRVVDHDTESGWELLNTGLGPSFAFSLFNTRKFKCVVSDPTSIARHRIVAAKFDINFTDDLITTSKAMNATINYTAKRRMDYTTSEVFIPEDYYFPVGDIFRILDEKSGHTKAKSIFVQAYQRRIAWDANIMPQGIHTFQILPFGFYQPTYQKLSTLNRGSCEC